MDNDFYNSSSRRSYNNVSETKPIDIPSISRCETTTPLCVNHRVAAVQNSTPDEKLINNLLHNIETLKVQNKNNLSVIKHLTDVNTAQNVMIDSLKVVIPVEYESDSSYDVPE